MATIFAWTGALKKRGELDSINPLVDFANKLEASAIRTIEEGILTKDLAPLSQVSTKHIVDTQEFLIEIKKRLDEVL